MEDKYITLAILNCSNAQSLKNFLENDHIDVIIENVPNTTDGLKISIKERDLNKALEAQNAFFSSLANRKTLHTSSILVPVDFSANTDKICELAFNFAYKIKAEVILLHALVPKPINGRILVSENPLLEALKGGKSRLKDEEDYNEKIEILKQKLDNKISNGKLPNVKFSFRIREGVPEDAILNYASKKNPNFILMTTQASNKTDYNLIGSIAAEVIDRSLNPVLIIPEKCSIKSFFNKKNLAFITNFDSRDLLAFDKSIKFLRLFDFKIYFLINETITEDQLNRTKQYFSENYPDLEFVYTRIKVNTLDEKFYDFLSKQNIEMLALTTHKHSVLRRLFNPSIAHEMVFHTELPLYVIHA